MSFKDLKNTEQQSKNSATKKVDLKKIYQQFNTLDMNGYGSWPIAVKVVCWIFIYFIICVLGYLLVIRFQLDDISKAEIEESTLLKEYREKDSKLRNLKLYEQQYQNMQLKFQKQLQQLPTQAEIPSLVENISQTGVKSGLKFKNIQLDNEVKREFFIEQPILIEASGDYHAFGTFVSNLAVLPRIVTLHDFEITAQTDPNKKSDIPKVNYLLKAKTYSYDGAFDKVEGEEPKELVK